MPEPGRADPLRTEQLRVDFGGIRALSDVSIQVRPAEIVGLIGPNGAGKTTLFDCVTGRRTPSAGRVLLFGEDATGAPAHRRARAGIARTFQRGELFGSLSVLDNLIVACHAADERGATRSTASDARDRAQAILDRVGLAAHAATRAEDLPIGFARLSEVARALCTEPRLLLLDEPSSGLRRSESERLADLVRGLRDAGRSLLVVEHDMDFVLGVSDRVYVLDFGRLIATGTPDEIRRDPAVQAAYLGEEVERGTPA